MIFKKKKLTQKELSNRFVRVWFEREMYLANMPLEYIVRKEKEMGLI